MQSAIEPNSELDSAPVELDRQARTSLRSDLQITRQVTKGSPVYVLYDPVSYRAHRLALDDYRVVAQLQEQRTLQEVFQQCVAEGILTHEDDSQFLGFVQHLDSLGLLSTSRQSPQVLYERFMAKRAMEKKSKLFDFLFVTIPLANPDRFLERSQQYLRPLFTRTAGALWLFSLLGACLLLSFRWHEFIAPLNGLLATQNLLFMLAAFGALKIWHELGHGYACKVFGGRVPEMGCKLIAGMPLAYVDASSTWSFPLRKHRIMVMLGGMYFESLVAIPAMLVWTLHPNSLLGSFAYQLVLMAGAATVLFNANPLMKFDGYFVLSDLLGIPNLRSKAIHEVQRVLKRYALGMHTPAPAHASKFLILFGIASLLYTTTVLLSILTLVALRFQVLGLMLAVCKLVSLLYRNLRRLFQYLLFSSETEAVRPRARRVAFGLAVALPLLLFVFPIPTGVQVPGLVTARLATTIRAATEGILRESTSHTNSWVEQGQAIAKLENIDTSTEQHLQQLAAEASRRKGLLVSRSDPAENAKLMHQRSFVLERLRQAEREKRELQVTAPHSGQLVYSIPLRAQGTFVRKGDPIAKVVLGNTLIRAYLTETQIAQAQVTPGSKVQVRFSDSAAAPYLGRVESVSPAQVSELQDLAVSTLAEGRIALNPNTQRPLEPVYLVRVALPELDSKLSLQDHRAEVLFGRNYETIAAWLFRAARNLGHSVLAK